MFLSKKFSLVATIAAAAAIASADTNPDPNLRDIMQGLRDDTVVLLDALLVDDMDTVADAAARIAGHPSIPPSQVAIVAGELGSEMAAFKQFDSLVHDLSLSIRSAALQANPGRARAGFEDMVNGCLACHATYRERVSAVLNPAETAEIR